MKTCSKCFTEKPIIEFYGHKKAADGHLSECKECTKKRVTARRWEKIDEIRQYDRDRGNRQGKEYLSNWRKRFPNKYKAETMVNNFIRDGKLFKEPCSICGETDRTHKTA